jgi:enamine deaminase RidA (YjgF/YER057c/UK114 family)
VRVGNIVTVSGTAPLSPDGDTVGKGDPAVQARRCLEIIAAALEKAGAVHGDFFRDIRPANTIMQVSRFIDPEWLVEFEADAVVDGEP